MSLCCCCNTDNRLKKAELSSHGVTDNSTTCALPASVDRGSGCGLAEFSGSGGLRRLQSRCGPLSISRVTHVIDGGVPFLEGGGGRPQLLASCHPWRPPSISCPVGISTWQLASVRASQPQCGRGHPRQKPQSLSNSTLEETPNHFCFVLFIQSNS